MFNSTFLFSFFFFFFFFKTRFVSNRGSKIIIQTESQVWCNITALVIAVFIQSGKQQKEADPPAHECAEKHIYLGITAARSCCDKTGGELIAGCKINRKVSYSNNTYSRSNIGFFWHAGHTGCEGRTSETRVIATRHLEIQSPTSTRIDLKARCRIDIIPAFHHSF